MVLRFRVGYTIWGFTESYYLGVYIKGPLVS